MTSQTGQTTNPTPAFTLIELILTLGLLAAILTITAPQLKNHLRQQPLKQETRRLHTLTQYTRHQAINQNLPITLWINPKTQQYGIHPQHNWPTNQHNTRTYQHHPNLTITTHPPPNTPQTHNHPPTIHYHPDGTTAETSIHTIQIQNTHNNQQTQITHNPHTHTYNITQP